MLAGAPSAERHCDYQLVSQSWFEVIHSGGWPHKGLPYGRLEPREGKLSSAVLRGLGVSNDPRLPGLELILYKLGLFSFCLILSDRI